MRRIPARDPRHTPALEIVDGALARESTLEFRRLEWIADEIQRMSQAAKVRQRAVQFVPEGEAPARTFSTGVEMQRPGVTERNEDRVLRQAVREIDGPGEALLTIEHAFAVRVPPFLECDRRGYGAHQ